MTLRKHLLNNMVKMLNWISEEFKKADCEVPYQYKFERGFIYGHSSYDYLEFCCNKNATFWFCHYNHRKKLKDGKLYEQDKEYTITRENEKGFKIAMEEWPRVKAAVLKHLEDVNKVANFEV